MHLGSLPASARVPRSSSTRRCSTCSTPCTTMSEFERRVRDLTRRQCCNSVSHMRTCPCTGLTPRHAEGSQRRMSWCQSCRCFDIGCSSRIGSSRSSSSGTASQTLTWSTTSSTIWGCDRDKVRCTSNDSFFG
jgi:hypothetical protein